VGSFYGAKLARAGHDVHFLLRSDYEVVRRQGVSIRSVDGDFQARPRCASRPEAIGPAELVLIGLKSTANEQFPSLLPPLVGPKTAVLTLQNGLGNEDQLARLFPAEQIMGGLCFVCLNRLAPGIIRHIGYGHVVLGEFQRPPLARTREIAASFNAAGIRCSVADNLERAHWEKLVWNIPFNGLGVAAAAGRRLLDRLYPGLRPGGAAGSPLPLAECLTTDRLLGDPAWERLVRELMLEIIAAARALGFDLPESLAEQQIERTRSMGAYRASTLIDFDRGLPLELESLFFEPLRQATQAGVAVPRLVALCEVLRDLDQAKRAVGESDRSAGTACG
jgi:2-dehydropantoate 2-reductase